MRGLVLLFLMLVAVGARAQEPTELYDCVNDADGPNFCTVDSTAVLVGEGCGATFNRYHGVITWPPLRNTGPVTISVRTLATIHGTTHLPLYIEVAEGVQGCRALRPGLVALVAQGVTLCGGVWESVGPIDLREYGTRLGDLYTIRAVFLESLPGTFTSHSIGFACIRVSHPLAVAPATWSSIKVIYR